MPETKPIKILLVDDNENNLLSMEVALEREGYQFARATSGREALRVLLKESDFSLILLDVKMPIMDGYETAKLIYEREKLRRIPIIFITAHDYEEAAMFKGYETGAVDFIRKPFNPNLLRSKVGVFAELYKKTQLLQEQEEQLRAINEDLVKLNQSLEERVRDRTLELETLNQELKALNLSKDKFLSVISHDLRNPLTSLLASAENLSRDAEKLRPDQVKLFSGIINRTSNKILEQLNELVDWAKNQREKVNFSPAKLKLQQAISESLELLRPTAAQKGIKLKNDIHPDIHVHADALMLRSILQNLVTNAIKFTPNDGAAIVVTAEKADSVVGISVQDGGVGMAEETKMILMTDRSVHSLTGTNQEKGSGLGLLLVKDFVILY